jgi:hypothetical protein
MNWQAYNAHRTWFNCYLFLSGKITLDEIKESSIDHRDFNTLTYDEQFKFFQISERYIPEELELQLMLNAYYRIHPSEFNHYFTSANNFAINVMSYVLKAFDCGMLIQEDHIDHYIDCANCEMLINEFDVFNFNPTGFTLAPSREKERRLYSYFKGKARPHFYNPEIKKLKNAIKKLSKHDTFIQVNKKEG